MKITFPKVLDAAAAARMDDRMEKCQAALVRERIDWATAVGLVDVDDRPYLHVDADSGEEFLLPFLQTPDGEVTFGNKVYTKRIPIETIFVEEKPATAAAPKPADKTVATTTARAAAEAEEARARRILRVATPEDREAAEAAQQAAARAQDKAEQAKLRTAAVERAKSEDAKRTKARDVLKVAEVEGDSEQWGERAFERESAARHERRGQPKPEPAKAKATVDSDPLRLEASRKAANAGKLPSEQI